MDEANVIQIDLPATHRFLNVLGASIAEMLARIDEPCPAPEIVYQIQLAAHEICTNIVEHAYAGSDGRIAITLRVVETPRRFIIELRDRGAHTFDPSRTEMPVPEELDLHGRGIMLVRASVEQTTYHARDGRCWMVRQDEDWCAVEPSVATRDQNVWQLVKFL